MKILALDPATRCGYAHADGSAAPRYGTWDLGISGSEHAGNKLVRLRDHIEAAIRDWGAERIAFEDASFGSNNANTAAFHNQVRGIIVMVAAIHRLPIRAYKPNAIKKFATGYGLAKKPQMMAALKTHFGIETADDNAADALWVLELARQEAAGRAFESTAKVSKRARSPRRLAGQPRLF